MAVEIHEEPVLRALRALRMEFSTRLAMQELANEVEAVLLEAFPENVAKERAEMFVQPLAGAYVALAEYRHTVRTGGPADELSLYRNERARFIRVLERGIERCGVPAAARAMALVANAVRDLLPDAEPVGS